MKKILKIFGAPILALISIVLVACSIWVIGKDSYTAGKASIQPSMEQTSNEFQLKIQQLQYSLTIKENENAELNILIDELEADKQELISSGQASQEQIDSLDAQIDIYKTTVAQNEAEISTLNNKVLKYISILDKTVTEVTADDLEGFTYISQYTFYHCDALVSVEFPSTLTSIGQNAFAYCLKLANVDFSRCSNLTTLGKSVFERCVLTSIDLSNCLSLTTIPDLAFIDCELVECILPDSIVAIGNNAFSGVDKLSSINLPASLTSIGQTAFNGCKKFTSFDLSRCENLTTIDAKAFQYCTGLVTVILPDTDISFGSEIFFGCTNLTNLTIHNVNLSKSSFAVGSGTSYGQSLTLDSLLCVFQALWDNSANTSVKTLYIGTNNKAKIEGVYIRLIDITDEMRAEDKYIDNKLPFEVCESTDEGAMLVNDYVTMKNWQLK